jgi:hypothetical protein
MNAKLTSSMISLRFQLDKLTEGCTGLALGQAQWNRLEPGVIYSE